MFFATQETTAQIQQVVDDAKKYLDLQRQHLSLQSAEKMTRLFATMMLVTILILVGFVVFLFAGMAAAHWLGSLLGSVAAGFGIVSGVALLLALLFYANRRAWIIAPTARFAIRLLASDTREETLEGVVREGEHVKEELDKQQTELMDSLSDLLSPTTTPQTNADRFVNMVHGGYNVMRGVEMGMAAMTTLRRLFRRRRR